MPLLGARSAGTRFLAGPGSHLLVRGRPYSQRPYWHGNTSIIDKWVEKEARPISLRQLMVFGRTLTEQRLISSANYVRTELPTRLAHRIRDLQNLPYGVATNPHISEVYDLYFRAFDTFLGTPEIKTLEDNDRFCKTISTTLRAHLPVIPKLAMGVLQCSERANPRVLDNFMNILLRSRISRRVIAEQHLSLTAGFRSRTPLPGSCDVGSEYIGKVFLKCVAKDVVQSCGEAVQSMLRRAYGPDVPIPDIKIEGRLEASFPYILSHIEYIISELLRNSIQAVVENEQRQRGTGRQRPPPSIEVTICESPHQVIIRISDRGGGIPPDVLPHIWSFSQGPASARLLQNLAKVPKMAATMQELLVDHQADDAHGERGALLAPRADSSLSTLSSRPPNLSLGMGLPLSRVYAEYWAGNLSLHNLTGYGVDVFLQIWKLGNKNEQLTTRASMDAV